MSYPTYHTTIFWGFQIFLHSIVMIMWEPSTFSTNDHLSYSGSSAHKCRSYTMADKQPKATVCERNWAEMLLKAVGQVSEGGSGRQSSKGAIFSKHGELASSSPFELFSRYASRWFPSKNMLDSRARFQLDRIRDS